MREEKVFIRGHGCSECLQADGRLTPNNENEKCIMKELEKETDRRLSISKHIELAHSNDKSQISNNEDLENQQEDTNSSQSQKLSLPKLTITTPYNDVEKPKGTEAGNYRNDAARDEDSNEETQKNGGKIAGRRALPEITITCPPVEVFESQDDDANNGIFTRRRYMICRDSPRSGKKRISLVDFPHGLSELEKHDSLYLESPTTSLDSPYSFSNLDLSFTYNSPLGSPFTPPFTPEMTKRSTFIYPGSVPAFSVEQSFPPAELKDEKVTAE